MVNKQESNSDTKRVIKNTAVLYLRMLIMMGLGLFTSRITLQALGVDDYGINSVVGGIVVVLGFLNNAMAGGTQRFINVALGKRDSEELNKVISNALLIHFGIALICLILAETIGLWFLNNYMVIPEGRMAAANWVYQFSVLTFVINILTVPYMASIIAHEKMSAFAWITIVDVVMKLVIVYALLYINTDKLILYAILIFISSNIVRYIYIRYCKNHFEECSIKSWAVDKSLMRSMVSFSSWTILGNLGFIAHTQGIAIVINLFFNVAVNAAQGIANQVNNYINQFVSNFLMAFNPQVVKTYAAGEIEEMHRLIIRGSKVSLLLVGLLATPLIIEMPNILFLWLGQVPEYTVIFVRLILLLTFFNSYSSLMAAAKGATGDIKIYQITLTIIGLLHLPLAWLFFVLGFEAYWAQVIYLFIIITLQIVRTWFVCRSIGMSQFFFYREAVMRSFFSIGVALIIPVLMHLYMPDNYTRTILVCIVSLFLSGITAFFIGLSASERTIMLTTIKNRIRR